MPCWELFEDQPEQYRRALLPPGVPKLAIEAGSSMGWWKFVGDSGGVVGLDRFGRSAPGETVYSRLGFGVERVVAEAARLIAETR
jgi:transketolase